MKNVNVNICLKGDSTKEIGKRIIKYLESIGGSNVNLYRGDSLAYYFIRDGIITGGGHIPPGYVLINLPEEKPEEKPFPKWMWVKDSIKDKEPLKRFVVFIDKNDKAVCVSNAKDDKGPEYIAYVNGDVDGYEFTGWGYYCDIKEDSTDEIQQLKNEVNNLKQQLKDLIVKLPNLDNVEKWCAENGFYKNGVWFPDNLKSIK